MATKKKKLKKSKRKTKKAAKPRRAPTGERPGPKAGHAPFKPAVPKAERLRLVKEYLKLGRGEKAAWLTAHGLSYERVNQWKRRDADAEV